MAVDYEERFTGEKHPSSTPIENRFWKKVEKGPGCWEWTGYRNKDNSNRGYQLPYGRVRVDGRLCLAHRVAWRLTHGPIPDGFQVGHRCDVPYCVNPDHLFLATPLENNRDKKRKGRAPAGQEAGRAILTADEVLEIRRRYESEDVSYRRLSEEYGVAKATIAHLIRRRTWSHL